MCCIVPCYRVQELYKEYEKEVLKVEQEGYPMANTRRTYLLHSHNFVKRCNNDFEPGSKIK